jgi:hypothetical protein
MCPGQRFLQEILIPLTYTDYRVYQRIYAMSTESETRTYHFSVKGILTDPGPTLEGGGIGFSLTRDTQLLLQALEAVNDPERFKNSETSVWLSLEVKKLKSVGSPNERKFIHQFMQARSRDDDYFTISIIDGVIQGEDQFDLDNDFALYTPVKEDGEKSTKSSTGV